MADIAMTYWRHRRVIRAESAAIDAHFEEIDDADRQAREFAWSEEEFFYENRSELEPGIAFLRSLADLDADTPITGNQFSDVLIVLPFSGLATPSEVFAGDYPEPPLTAGSVRDYVAGVAKEYGVTYDSFVHELCTNARVRIGLGEISVAERERERKQLERAALLRTPAEMDRFIRGEAHLDRRLDKLHQRLELLQRLRSGQDVPAPFRIHITGEDETE